MKCERCKQKLIPYLEESLQVAESKEMETHLGECASCRRFAEYLSESLSIIGSSRITEFDPFFYTRVKARIDKQNESYPVKSGLVSILQPAVFSLLLMAAIFAGVEIGRVGGSSKTDNYALEDLNALVNELGSEPIETFLMD
jgi:hypothetical protein